MGFSFKVCVLSLRYPVGRHVSFIVLARIVPNQWKIYFVPASKLSFQYLFIPTERNAYQSMEVYLYEYAIDSLAATGPYSRKTYVFGSEGTACSVAVEG